MAVLETRAFTAEGDADGIFDYLAGDKVGDPWADPVGLGHVSVMMSNGNAAAQSGEKLFDSTDITWTSVSMTTGSTLYTQAWECDLGVGFGVTITDLTMRGMQDTNWRMKNWKLEGRVDGESEWVSIVSDDGTVTVNAAGGYATWEGLTGTDVFRFLKLQSTGIGWNNAHERFAAGYFEIWGTYETTAELTITGEAWFSPPLKLNGLTTGLGIMDWLGKVKGTTTFENPSTSRGVVDGDQSTLQSPGLEYYAALTHDFVVATGRAHTTNVANSWIKYDFQDGNLVNLFDIDIQSQDDGTNNPKQIEILGSLNDSDWVSLGTIYRGNGDAKHSFFNSGFDSSVAYRYFKLEQTATNLNGSNYLIIGEVEFYGLYNAAFGAGGGALPTVEYGDTLLRALQDAGATSKEVVGALNELNGTTGVEFDLAYRTYIA